MFHKTRRKVVATIMGLLMILWIGTLCVIYASSYYEVYQRNIEMLSQHATFYSMGKTNTPIERNPEGPPNKLEPDFMLSTFYSVAVSYEGEILEISNSQTEIYETQELQEIAYEVLNTGKTKGVKKNLIYYVADKGGYQLVVFMDNTIMQNSMSTLFRYTLLCGAVVMILLYFIAEYLAKKIIHPIEEAYQKQRQFISDAGHELKTPISIVNVNAELLSREIGDNQWLSNIQYENDRMGKLVAQLLELARTENVACQMQTIDLSRVVKGEVLPFESILFEENRVLESHIAEKVFVKGNSSELKKLTSILLDNAVRYGDPQKEIGITLRTQKHQAILSVVNAGEELKEEERKRIFERFYRLDPVRNGEENHYGLGLSIASAIVEKHHGKLEVLCYNGKIEFAVSIPLQKEKNVQ